MMNNEIKLPAAYAAIDENEMVYLNGGSITDTQIQFPVVPLLTEIISHNCKAQLVHIEISCFFIVRNNNRNMMNRR